MIVSGKTRREMVDARRKRIFMPRVQMTIILSLTGIAGFLTSFALLTAGITQMWLRYPLAIVSAYAAFLVLLRIWLAFQDSTDFDDPGITLDFGFNSNPVDGDLPVAFDSAAGGDFGGGGAGGSWGESVSTGNDLGGGSSAFDGIDLDLQELWLLVIAVAALIGGLIASLYIVYIAPYLLAEIFVDGLLLRGLYLRINGIEQRNWLHTAIRRTWVTALLSLIFFAIAGGVIQIAVPGAKSIGEVLRSSAAKEAELG